MRTTLLATLLSVALPVGAMAQSADDLKNDHKTTDDVLTYGMGLGQQRFSPLHRFVSAGQRLWIGDRTGLDVASQRTSRGKLVGDLAG